MNIVELYDILTVLTLFLFIFATAEYLYRKKISTFITRKIVHMGSGIIAALLPLLIDLNTTILLGLSFTLFLVYTKKQKLLESIHNISDVSIGALIFAPSLTLSAILFWPTNPVLFQGAGLILGLSDGLAGIIGKKYGKWKYSITGEKTIEGNVIFLSVTILIMLGILVADGVSLTHQILFFVFGGSLLLTTIESLLSRGWDNLFIPVVSGIILYLIL